MWLLRRILVRLIRRGELVVIDHDGKRYEFGRPDPELGRVVLRFSERRGGFDIAT